ncbi:hypothetical protein ACOMHN_037127 [Nucella lapillus]
MTLQEAIETLSVKLQKAVETINERLESLSAKSVVVQMRAEVKDLTDMFKEKIEGIEGRLLDVECKIDNLESGSRNAKKFNEGLKNMVTQCDSCLKQCEKEQNDLQQYSRRWNLRVYRVPEQTKETAGDCVDKVVKIVNEGVGVKLTQGDVEVAHRTGHQSGKQARPIIVRFFDRRKRDEILQNRRKLKNKGTVIGEDLTYANYQLSKRAMEHSLTIRGKHKWSERERDHTGPSSLYTLTFSPLSGATRCQGQRTRYPFCTDWSDNSARGKQKWSERERDHTGPSSLYTLPFSPLSGATRCQGQRTRYPFCTDWSDNSA